MSNHRKQPPTDSVSRWGLLSWAFTGPLLVGWVTYWAPSQRVGMSVIIGYFIIGLILMMTVPAAEKDANK